MAKREMPSFDKSPAELVARFDAAAGRFPAAQHRKMFGYPALFIGGNLVTGLFADSWMIRLAPDDLADLMAMPGAGSFEPMPGKPMKAFVVIPSADVSDDAAIAGWVERGLAHAASMPAKK